jgi:translation initiation factor IF-1
MKAQRAAVERFEPGDRVRVQLDNGYTNTGTVRRTYKNGAVLVAEDNDRCHHRSWRDLTKLTSEGV